MSLHVLKQELQAHLSDGLLLIVGSGVSCAEGLPGMGELADHLRLTIGPLLAGGDAAAWAEIEPLIATKGLEAALLEKAPPAGVEAVIAATTGSFIAERERRVVAEVFNGHRILRMTRLVPHLLKPSAGMPIITTNYDRLVEIGVEEAGVGVDTMFVGRFAARLNERESRFSFCRNGVVRRSKVHLEYQSRALVHKPHGSLDWYLRAGTPVHYTGDVVGAVRLIITPGQNKFRNGYESPFDHHRARANEAIDRASRYLILGYGFNDDHLETHLTPAIRSGKPTLLMTRSLSPKAKALSESCGNIIALEYSDEAGVEGTRVISEKNAAVYPGSRFWDVGEFVTEVLGK